MSIQKKIDELREEIMTLRRTPDVAKELVSDAKTFGKSQIDKLEHQVGDLNKMVKVMLEEAENTVSDHPVATVAGALALGIVIGRLSGSLSGHQEAA